MEPCGSHDEAAPRDAGCRDLVAGGVDVAFGYYGGALATAIRRMKYEDRPDLARPLGALLRGACRGSPIRAKTVLPVPLHPRRLVERGYNQAALLAAHVARELDAHLDSSVLVRTIDTAPQAKLSGSARQTNLTGAFAVMAPGIVEGRDVVVVDDVATTGATLRACREALTAAGARRTVGVILARTAVGALGDSART